MSTRRRRGSTIGWVLCGLFVLVALAGPALDPRSPLAEDLSHVLAAPSAAHWLGTDANGADLLAELLHGARLALLVAGVATAVSFVVGLAVGASAGLAGGAWDELAMRLVDVVSTLPGLLLNLAIVALLAGGSMGVLLFALCANGWVGYARVARGEALALAQRELVTAARATGVSPARLLWRHVVPNLLRPLVVQATFGFAGTVATMASLSFLGLGAPQPYDWGALIAQGAAYLWIAPRLLVVPAVALALLVLGCTLLGDSLARLDPRNPA